MVSVGNKAVLVSSEQCQHCAKCCKEFNMSCDLDLALRFQWMNSEDLDVTDTPFFLSANQRERNVCFNKGCWQLVKENGVYRCKTWNKDRPDFCNTYPDHCFYHIPEWNREHIEKQLEMERARCPGLLTVSVEDVITMLTAMRKR